MRAVVQRVKASRVEVDNKVIGEIGVGLNVLVGISKEDTKEDLEYIVRKIVGMRIFEDETGKMTHSLEDVNGELLIISQFTLYGDCRKGKRPDFMKAQGGEAAEQLYNELVEAFKKEVKKVETGEFGADMQVYIQNDGPVTLLLESKKDF
ncbi:D-tyrosyl-tRNA(Tyr) deacylase [Clostridium punense]|uniref:D-aminoacyl-tRNA deacylase n=1 Tax=Clostridium punense TaxID=1054297 RepID=A0ABS4JY31_9CLOT|nr:MULTISPECIES: D-aminoacyl-tRNA deacylase [Clostridium]EQB87150.1 D-tyrosyl-tRNA(Tyr) deacylase [Clostridium sp. BL8]MBP2020440.1 D-tyrosyl-tRNA(Tyr) deacylase [Clostridium punense]